MKTKKIKKISTPAYSVQNPTQSEVVFPGVGKDFGKFLTTGKWTETDPKKDRKVQQLAQFMSDPPKPFDGAKKQIMVDGKKYIQLKNEIAKKRLEQNKKTLMYTLIDPKNRETEKLANSMFPELLKTNDEFFRENLELQKSIYRMLQRGTIESRKDMEDLYHMLINPDFFLPLGPSWDPNKIIFKRSIFKYIASDREKTIGIWNPKRIFNTWPSQSKRKNEYNYQEILETIKTMGYDDLAEKIDPSNTDGHIFDQVFLKLAFAARVCPMFSDKDITKSRDLEEMVIILQPILTGVDGLDVDIFEADVLNPPPPIPPRVFNRDVMEQPEE